MGVGSSDGEETCHLLASPAQLISKLPLYLVLPQSGIR
ncbi:hypothetical protein HKBW3C_01879 [Candidatus Hakubella thermalkaliphila]|nr:hypothetical protein HKBW3C_01879 [Candidatus Hakubella thermalkaliphila]